MNIRRKWNDLEFIASRFQKTEEINDIHTKLFMIAPELTTAEIVALREYLTKIEVSSDNLNWWLKSIRSTRAFKLIVRKKK